LEGEEGGVYQRKVDSKSSTKVEWFEEQFSGQKKGIICGTCGMEKATNKMN